MSRVLVVLVAMAIMLFLGLAGAEDTFKPWEPNPMTRGAAR